MCGWTPSNYELDYRLKIQVDLNVTACVIFLTRSSRVECFKRTRVHILSRER